MRVLIKNISLLFFFIIFFVFSIPAKSNAYDCYDASNAKTLAPDNGTVCAGMYIVPNTVGAGSTKLKKAIHSGSNAYISHGGEQYWLGEESGKKKVFTGQVKNFERVFYNKKNFNGDIGYWDMSSATTTAEMFKGAKKFNQDIGDWNMSKNKWYWGMFYNAKKFNQDISSWNTGNARSFSTMFVGALKFNQDISGWNTSKVITMHAMFQKAIKFNQPLHNWNLSKLIDKSKLSSFLRDATAYDKDLSCLDVSHFPATGQPWRFSSNSQLTTSKKPKWGRSVPSSCTDPPTLLSSTPADDDTNVSNTTNIFLTFDENVNAGDGDIIIKKTSDNTVFERIAANSNLVTGTGTNLIEINPSNTFASGTEYYVVIDSDAFQDLSGNYYAGILSITALSFTTQDTGSPYITSKTPVHLATDIAVDANIVLSFSETVISQSGGHYITIFNNSDGTEFEKIDVTNVKVSGSGTNQITVNPTSNFVEKSTYYVNIDSTAFQDSSGNSFIGIGGTNNYKFTIAGTTPPTLSTSSPSDDATNVNTLSSLVLTFDEPIDAETGGEIYLYKSDNTLVKTYSVTDTDYVNRSSPFAYTVDISAELEVSTSYYIKINEDAFDDTAGNSFAEISDAITLNFTTADTNCGCVAGQLLNKNDTGQSGATVQLLDSSNNLIDSAITDDEGRYDLYPSTTGIYKVLYVKGTNKKWKAKNAHGKFNGRYVEEIEFTTDCEEYLDMDAILIDPAGVVYDSSTRAAISGATVRLFFNGALVNNDWLDSATGTNTEITGSDGQYNFVLNGNASSGDYVLEVEPPSGYIFESSNIPAETSTYIPGFGAGIETIQDQDTAPTTSEETNYYLTFAFTIAALASDTSNGVIHNHIPVDSISDTSKELVNKSKAPLTKVLKQDFHDTVSGQMNLFNDIARQSLGRLDDRFDDCGDINSDLNVDVAKIMQAFDQELLEGDYLSKINDCNIDRSFYTDAKFSISSSHYVGMQYMLQINQTQEFKIHDDRLRGIFYGGYISNSDVTAAADGTIEGRGLHLGVYETIHHKNLNYNYYGSVSHGKHNFNFDILDGFTPDRIKTKGDYGYFAGYTGASVSGNKQIKNISLTPRISVDSSYAVSDEVQVDFTAQQKSIEQSGSLELDNLISSRTTAELAIYHPGAFSDWNVITEVTPKLFCQQDIGEIKETCGYGGAITFQGINNRYGEFALVLGFNQVDQMRSENYQITHSIIFFENLSFTSGYAFDERMKPVFDTVFEYSIDF